MGGGRSKLCPIGTLHLEVWQPEPIRASHREAINARCGLRWVPPRFFLGGLCSPVPAFPGSLGALPVPLELNSQVVPTVPGENLEVSGPGLWRLAEAREVAAGRAQVSVMSPLVVSSVCRWPVEVISGQAQGC